MKPDSSDPMLARLFERQRDADQRAVPEFSRLSRTTRPTRRARVPVLPSAFTLAAVMALAVTQLRLPPPTAESNATTLARVSTFSIATWQAPTDSLLQSYTQTPLTSLSPLAGSWTDALISSPGSVDAQP